MFFLVQDEFQFRLNESAFYPLFRSLRYLHGVAPSEVISSIFKV
jgi:hypothetical protein